MKKFHQLDLNLVRVFVAVYETRSVTHAAARLFVTQPSISYALSKLRDLMGDPLFTRGADGMVPTLYASELHQGFREGLGSIQDSMESVGGFDAARSQRRFRISMSDIGAFAFLPPLINRIEKLAPGVEIEVAEPAVSEIPAQLASGQIDAAVGHLTSINSQTSNAFLFKAHYSCLVRRGHPTIKNKLTLEKYLAARHAYVSSGTTGHSLVESTVRELGYRRKVALQIPHFTALPTILAQCDLIATLPSGAADMLTTMADLKSLPLPLPIPEFEVRLHWSARRKKNAAVAWFLDVVRSALAVF